ncbi:MAG: acyltransferase family protein [Mariprofundales bacterium]
MSKNFSLFLDCVRALAALIVVGSHLSNPRLQGEWLAWAHQFGHEAVIVFFVLSGLVIAYVSQQRECTLQTFTVARFARLWSVALLALLFTFFADWVGRSLEPSIYSPDWYYDNLPLLRLLASALFINEVWFAQIVPLSDGPFWSLSYEFWYYVIFASLYFFSGWKRIVLCVIAIAIAGPKILLLWPIWLMGLAVWYIIQQQSVRPAMAMRIGVAALLLLVWSQYVDIESSFYYLFSMPLLTEWQPILEWRMSARFLSDWVDGALIAMIFLGTHALVEKLPAPHVMLTWVIRYVASATLFIYLFHYPLIYLLHAVGVNIGLDADGSLQVWLLVMTLALLLIFGPMVEKTKSLWKVWMNGIYNMGRVLFTSCLQAVRR